MSIDSVVKLTVPETLSKRKNTSTDLDSDDFMKLLVAELKHQDPLEPLKSREMITQLSQLTSVQTLKQVNKGILAMQAELAGIASTQIAGLLGKTVTAEANHVQLGYMGSTQGLFQLDAVAEQVTVVVRNAAGKEVRRMELGKTLPGNHTFDWDGNNNSGERADVGRYSVEVSAVDGAGIKVASSSKVSGFVSEVSYENGYPELIVDGMKITLGDVTSIAQ